MKENNNDLFQKIGVDISQDKINIDLTKTKDFFTALQGIFQAKAENLKQDLSEGKVNLGEDVGIQIDNEHINIDLEKTKSFIEEFGQKIENFLGEIDKAVENIDTTKKK